MLFHFNVNPIRFSHYLIRMDSKSSPPLQPISNPPIRAHSPPLTYHFDEIANSPLSSPSRPTVIQSIPSQPQPSLGSALRCNSPPKLFALHELEDSECRSPLTTAVECVQNDSSPESTPKELPTSVVTDELLLCYRYYVIGTSQESKCLLQNLMIDKSFAVAKLDVLDNASLTFKDGNTYLKFFHHSQLTNLCIFSIARCNFITNHICVF